jgi:hypothetical protein
VPQSVQQGWPRLLQGVTRLFQTLPAALKNREDAQREEDFGLGDDFDDDEEDEEWEGEDWDHEEGEEAIDVKDESTAYLDFLSQQASKFSAVAGDDDDDDELEEESLLETPLDQMEPYGLFKAALQCKFPNHHSLEVRPQYTNISPLTALSESQPQLYAQLTATLSPEEQQVVKTAVEEADKIALVAAQVQQEGGAIPPAVNGA